MQILKDHIALKQEQTFRAIQDGFTKTINAIQHLEWSPCTAVFKKFVLLKSQELYRELESSSNAWSLPYDGDDVFAHLCLEFLLESLICAIFKRRW